MDRRSLHNPVKAADVPALKCDAAVPGGLDDRHPVGRPVDVIGGKGEADDPSFSSFVNPCRADDSLELDTVNTFPDFGNDSPYLFTPMYEASFKGTKR